MPAAELLMQNRTPVTNMFNDGTLRTPEAKPDLSQGWGAPIAFCGEREPRVRSGSPLGGRGQGASLAAGVFEDDLLDARLSERVRSAASTTPSGEASTGTGSWMDMVACGANRNSSPDRPLSG